MSDSHSEDWTRDFVAEASEALGSDDVGVEGDELVCRFVVQRGMSSWKQSEPVTVRVSLGAPSEWGADENVTPGEAAWTLLYEMVSETLDKAAVGGPSRWPVSVENWHPTERWPADEAPRQGFTA